MLVYLLLLNKNLLVVIKSVRVWKRVNSDLKKGKNVSPGLVLVLTLICKT